MLTWQPGESEAAYTILLEAGTQPARDQDASGGRIRWGALIAELMVEVKVG
jgi:hypothetical protein